MRLQATGLEWREYLLSLKKSVSPSDAVLGGEQPCKLRTSAY